MIYNSFETIMKRPIKTIIINVISVLVIDHDDNVGNYLKQITTHPVACIVHLLQPRSVFTTITMVIAYHSIYGV